MAVGGCIQDVFLLCQLLGQHKETYAAKLPQRLVAKEMPQLMEMPGNRWLPTERTELVLKCKLTNICRLNL